jgi:uncharacterized protein (TIGR03000 family)
MPRHLLLTSVLGVTFTTQVPGAFAQAPPSYRYFGVAVGVAPYGYFGFYPSAYSASWSNGFSLYGPPVPTYGPVPGAFGGWDQRLSNFRYGTADRIKVPAYGEGLVTPTYVQVDLTVPTAEAEVTVNGVALKNKGAVRTFRALQLAPNAENLFHIRIDWLADGHEQHLERDIVARTGTTVRVDLSEQEPLPAPRKAER